MYNRQALIDRYIMLVERLHNQMYVGPLNEWQGLEITLPHLKTMVTLEQQGPLRMGEISRSLGSTLSATTSIVDRLVGKGLLERMSDPDDRRVVICGLTDLGRKAAVRYWGHMKKLAIEVAGQWNQEELETVVRGLELIWTTDRKVRSSLDP